MAAKIYSQADKDALHNYTSQVKTNFNANQQDRVLRSTVVLHQDMAHSDTSL